jgi:sec-independent protein translocase protein TatB
MFDITSSKLLILAVVALIVVGPKDLPILLRTVGKYLGVIRRQAAEFRGQLDQAMREAELDELQREFEGVRKEMRDTMDAGVRAIDRQVDAARVDVEAPSAAQLGISAAPAAAPPAEAAAAEAGETRVAANTDALPAPGTVASKEPGREPT